MKIFIKTYGCTLNRADSEIMEGLLLDKGYDITHKEEEADIIIVNTCTVKGATENKIRFYLDSLQEQKKNFIITGCMSITDLSKYNAPVISSGATKHIVEVVEALKKGEILSFNSFESKAGLPKTFTPPICRIGIEDGCLDYCYFCQTKQARPGLRSVPIPDIIRWFKTGLKKGCKEFQFSGTDTGAYGFDIKTNVVELLNRVGQIDGDYMIRLGMINPHHVLRLEEGLKQIFEKKYMYKFLHAAVQSGSEKVVKEMNRGHSVNDFIYIARVFSKMGLTIATDIIVGYPTETEDDFEKTIKLLENTPIEVVNVSKFTPRKGTVAARMKQLDSHIIKKRSVNLHDLLKELLTKRNEKYIGKEFDVLITEKQKGRTKQYKQVVLNQPVEIGKWYNVYIETVSKTSLFGRLT